MKNSRCRVISVASGKGGVGKTSFSLNLAYSLSKNGKKVCIIDADLGLANIDVVLGINPKHTLEDVIFKNKPIGEIICNIDENLDLLPGSSGIPALADLNPHQRRELINSFSLLEGYDFIIIDNSPGIAPSVLSFCLSTKELIVLFSPEPTAITDAYALIKSLKENGLRYPPLLVLNKAKDKDEIKKIMGRMNEVCKKFLGITTVFLGAVFDDLKVADELKLNAPVCKIYPNAISSRCYNIIASRIINRPRQDLIFTDLQDVMEKSIAQFTSRINQSKEKPINILDTIKNIKWQLKNGFNTYDKSYLQSLQKEIVGLKELIEIKLKNNIKNKTIGIISLDSSMKSLVKEILLDRGYEICDLTKDPFDAKKIDLVIYHHIPYKNIPEELNKLFYMNIPFLVISSFNYTISHQSVKAFLRSPFDIQDFYHQVEQLLRE